MKTLIVYYSRTDVTKTVAEKIQKELNCDIDEITDDGKYSGKIGYMKGGFNAVAGKCDEIHPSKNPSDYDLIIIGTPVWASTMATPIYSYLLKYHDQIKNLACFCTCMSSGYDKTFKKVSDVSKKELKSKMYIKQNDINTADEKISNFIEKLNK